jgi:hypothetical protein
MDTERIFSAEQIKVHPELAQIIREYSKAVIKESPDNITEFSFKYFQKIVDAKEAVNQKRIDFELTEGNITMDE